MASLPGAGVSQTAEAQALPKESAAASSTGERSGFGSTQSGDWVQAELDAAIAAPVKKSGVLPEAEVPSKRTVPCEISDKDVEIKQPPRPGDQPWGVLQDP